MKVYQQKASLTLFDGNVSEMSLLSFPGCSDCAFLQSKTPHCFTQSSVTRKDRTNQTSNKFILCLFHVIHNFTFFHFDKALPQIDLSHS